jgi:hypothetical protein
MVVRGHDLRRADGAAEALRVDDAHFVDAQGLQELALVGGVPAGIGQPGFLPDGPAERMFDPQQLRHDEHHEIVVAAPAVRPAGDQGILRPQHLVRPEQSPGGSEVQIEVKLAVQDHASGREDAKV